MSIDARTEMRRLSALLHKPVSELDYLADLDAEALLSLRHWLQNRLLDEFEHRFERIAASGRLIPDKLNALLARKVFGATLVANLSYYTPPERAARMCAHMTPEFMADIARETIPERASELLNGLPVDLMRDVTRLLAQSQDYFIMGGFTDILSDERVLALMEEIDDPGDLLRISSYSQRKDRIAELTAGFPDETIRSLVSAAAGDPLLLRETMLIVSNMKPDDQKRLASLADEVESDFRTQVGALASEEGIAELVAAYVTG